MCSAFERGADVLGQRPDVGALAAADEKLEVRRAPRAQPQLADLDRARRARDLDAAARVLVVLASFMLERSVARRHLGDAPDEVRQDGVDVVLRDLDRTGREDLTV